MIGACLKVSWRNERYSMPPFYKVGDTVNREQLLLGKYRELLKKDFTQLTGPHEEVWIYPYTSNLDYMVLPSKKTPPKEIFDELGMDLKKSAIFLDLDDKEAHQKKVNSEENFFLKVENCVANFRTLPGFFYYRTLRGCRLGFIFENGQNIDLALNAQNTIYLEVGKALKDYPQVEIDTACKNISRGFAVPHMYKRGQIITEDHAQLYIHSQDTPDAMVKDLADMYKKTIAAKTQPRNGTDSPSDSNPKRERRESSSRKAKSRVYVPADIKEQGRTEAYYAWRALNREIHKICGIPELREQIAALTDQYLCDGARTEKGDLYRLLDELKEAHPPREGEEEVRGLEPAPSPIEGHPELEAMTRVFERGDDLELAEAVLNCFGQNPSPIWHGNGLRKYIHEIGVWRYYNPHSLRRIAMASKGAITMTEKGSKDYSVSFSKIKASLELLSSLCGADEESTPFDTAPSGIVLGDKFIEATTQDGLRVLNNSPDHFAIHYLNFSLPERVKLYWEEDPQGAAPPPPKVFIDTFLKVSLSRPHEDGEDPLTIEKEIEAKICTILEWIGLALLGLCTREAVALIVYGPGSNGKSVLTKLIEDLFGKERTCHLPPQQMGERFSRAQLFGKAVNVVSEMPETDLLASDTLKAIISGDTIEVEKKHKDPFSFTPRAGHIFACNKLPASRDRSWGLWRRLLPIEFHHVFTQEDKDPDLLHKLRSEYDLLVPYALEKARQYLLNRGFKHQDYIHKWRWSWRSQTDAVAGFMDEKCTIVLEPKGGDELKTLWTSFKEWCEEVGATASGKMSLKAFSASLEALPQVKKKRVRKDGKLKTRVNVVGPKLTSHQATWKTAM